MPLLGSVESGNLVGIDPVVAAVIPHGADLAVPDGEEDLWPWNVSSPDCFGDLHAFGHRFNPGQA